MEAQNLLLYQGMSKRGFHQPKRQGGVQKRYRALVLGHYPKGHRGRCEQPLYGKSCETLLEAVEEPVETPEGMAARCLKVT